MKFNKFALIGFLSISSTSLLLVSAIPAQAAFFQGLGDLPGGNPSFYSIAAGISGDGKVVVGHSSSANGTEAFRWTEQTGMVGLGDLAGGNFFSTAYGVSDDGAVIVGVSDLITGAGGIAFRWTATTGMRSLGDLPGGSFTSAAYGVSGDGFITVGQGNVVVNDISQAFRLTWFNSGSVVSIMENLGSLPAGSIQSRAKGVSRDGSVIVGDSSSSNGGEAFRWTQQAGMVGLGDLPGGTFLSAAETVSRDGSVIIGMSDSNNGYEAFRWTANTGMIALGGLGGIGNSFRSEAYGVSDDGSVIVGRSFNSSGQGEAFIWDSTNGIRSLKTVLVNDFGLDLTGWTLLSARGVSADGLTIVGFADNPNGQTEAWIANLSSTAAVPEPLTILGAITAFGFGVTFKRRLNESTKK